MMFLLETQNIPFTTALCLMLFLALLEGVLLLIGAGLSDLLDSLIPDIDTVDLDATGPVTRLLGWVRIGKVPTLLILVVFLTSFGLLGLALQAAVGYALPSYLPAWVASVITFFVSLPVVRVISGWLGNSIAKEETESISRESFIGRVATITLGVASPGNPAEAKFTDQFGTTHYVMIEPDEQETFKQGEALLIVRASGSQFFGIRPPKHIL